MTIDRHPLDGNAIAADQHYGQVRPSDYDFCDRCGTHFTSEDPDEETRPQHPVLFMYCEDCGDDLQDEMEDER